MRSCTFSSPDIQHLTTCQYGALRHKKLFILHERAEHRNHEAGAFTLLRLSPGGQYPGRPPAGRR